MKKRMKKLLCALCAALMLCLTPFAALGEGEVVIYVDENGKEVTEFYNDKGELEGYAVKHTDTEGKEVTEYYNDKGELYEYDFEYTDADGCDVEEWYNAADNQLIRRTVYKGEALQRRERYAVDPVAGYYLAERSVGYQENGVDYIAMEHCGVRMDGGTREPCVNEIEVSHEEEGKKITYVYGIPISFPGDFYNHPITYPLDEADNYVKLRQMKVESTDESGNLILEIYNLDGKLTERKVWDADDNPISEERYDDAGNLIK